MCEQLKEKLDQWREWLLGEDVQILHAHEIICQIAEFIGQNFFLRSIGNPLPVPQYNQFEHFEKPWVAEESLKRLHEWWRNYDASTNEWLKWDWQSEYAAHGASRKA
jgi:hypothetical protein